MKKLSFLIIISFSTAQISSSGNSETRIGENKSGFYFNETLINTNLEYGNFYNWLQFEFSDPPEIGRSLNKIRKLQIEYKNENLKITVDDPNVTILADQDSDSNSAHSFILNRVFY